MKKGIRKPDRSRVFSIQAEPAVQADDRPEGFSSAVPARAHPVVTRRDKRLCRCASPRRLSGRWGGLGPRDRWPHRSVSRYFSTPCYVAAGSVDRLEPPGRKSDDAAVCRPGPKAGLEGAGAVACVRKLRTPLSRRAFGDPGPGEGLLRLGCFADRFRKPCHLNRGIQFTDGRAADQ